jgi:sigma-B regulation protein RsbU (phosphoserine phosphatase)
MAEPARMTRVQAALSLRRPLRGALIALAVVAVLVGVVENRRASRTVDDAATAGAVLGTMEARFAVSHTWVEEHVSGDESVDVQAQIFDNLSQAAALCRAMRDGGDTPFGPVHTVDDRVVRERTRILCRDIEAFAPRTEARVASGTDPGSAEDAAYDEAFDRTLSGTQRLRVRLEDIGDDARHHAHLAQAGVIAILIALVAAAGTLVRRREQQLTQAADDRDAVLQSAGDGILAFDRDGEIHFVNAAAAELLGWAAPDLIGRHVRTVAGGDATPDDDGLPEWMRVTAATVGDDRELRRRDGGAFPIAYTLSPAAGHDERGTLVLTFRDIAPRRRIEAMRNAELTELRTIKAALVPPPGASPRGLDVATCHVPAQEGVAGDFHLVVDGPGDRTAVIVGDVAGKGLDAARRAAYVRAVLASLAPYERSPRRLLEMANRSLVDTAGVSEFFVTAACLVVDPLSRTVTWATAGHPAPMVLDTGEVLAQRPSLPLGLTEAFKLEEQDLLLSPGEGVLLYTDGLSEARVHDSPDPHLLSVDRIARAVRDHAGEPPEDLVLALRAVAEAHSRGRLADDLCIVALRMAAVSGTASPGESPSPEADGAVSGHRRT